MFRALVLLAALAALATPAAAQTRYDGAWSVLVVTQSGRCDVYRWQVLVQGGRISSPGMPVQAAGGIDRRGAVNVAFYRGNDSLRASGRLNVSYGSGRWSAPSQGCSGSWRAERMR